MSHTTQVAREGPLDETHAAGTWAQASLAEVQRERDSAVAELRRVTAALEAAEVDSSRRVQRMAQLEEQVSRGAVFGCNGVSVGVGGPPRSWSLTLVYGQVSGLQVSSGGALVVAVPAATGDTGQTTEPTVEMDSAAQLELQASLHPYGTSV